MPYLKNSQNLGFWIFLRNHTLKRLLLLSNWQLLCAIYSSPLLFTQRSLLDSLHLTAFVQLHLMVGPLRYMTS